MGRLTHQMMSARRSTRREPRLDMQQWMDGPGQYLGLRPEGTGKDRIARGQDPIAIREVTPIRQQLRIVGVIESSRPSVPS